MRDGKRLSWIGIVGALLAALGEPAAQGQEKAAQLVPLVQLQGYEFICKGVGLFGFGGHYCSEGTAQERSITIFRSGRVISILTGAKETASEPGNAVYAPRATTVREPQASRRAILDLAAFLNAQGISYRNGPCDPVAPAPLTDLSRQFTFANYTIVWFLADGRRSYTVLDSRSTRACPPQLHSIFDAIVDFGARGARSAELE